MAKDAAEPLTQREKLIDYAVRKAVFWNMSRSVPSKKLLRMWSQNLPEKAVEDIRGAFRWRVQYPNFQWKTL